MNAQALFLNKHVGGAGVHLDTGRQGNGSQRAMRRYSHVVSLGHCRNFAAFADAARVG